MSRLFEFHGRTLCEAVRNTFSRRATPLPDGLPTAFTEEFRQDTQKHTQWQAFVHKAKPEPAMNSFDAVIDDVVAFLMPVVGAISNNGLLDKVWVPGGPWR